MKLLAFFNLILTPGAFFVWTLIYGTVAQHFGLSHNWTIVLTCCIALSFIVRRFLIRKKS
jgi:membrane protein implicated in regulation of membrane protease activity